MTVATDLAPPQVEARLERVRRLQARVHQLEDTRVGETRDVLPALAPLFPARGLRPGAAYAVEGSTTLATSLLVGASRSGDWCGVVGVPGLGAESLAALGADLERTVLVPDPAEHWVAVTAALVDVLSVVVLRTPAAMTAGDASRLQARLRRHGTTLVALGDWPRPEARLRIADGRWYGLGAGHGHLRARWVSVYAELRAGRGREAELWLPDADNRIRPAEAVERAAVPERAAG